MSDNKALSDFVQANGSDMQALGLLFLRLLRTDFNVLSPKPSPLLFAIMVANQEVKLGTTKKIEELISELEVTGDAFITDGFGGSILRL